MPAKRTPLPSGGEKRPKKGREGSPKGSKIVAQMPEVDPILPDVDSPVGASTPVQPAVIGKVPAWRTLARSDLDWLYEPSRLGGAARAIAVGPLFESTVRWQLARVRTWIEQKESLLALVWWTLIALIAPFVVIVGVSYQIQIMLWGFIGVVVLGTVTFSFLAVSRLYYRLGISIILALTPYTVFQFWDATYRDAWVEALSFWILLVVTIPLVIWENYKGGSGNGLALVIGVVLYSFFQGIDYTIQWKSQSPSQERYQWVAIAAAGLCFLFFLIEEHNQGGGIISRKHLTRPQFRLRRWRQAKARALSEAPGSKDVEPAAAVREEGWEAKPRPRNAPQDFLIAEASCLLDVEGAPEPLTDGLMTDESAVRLSDVPVTTESGEKAGENSALLGSGGPEVVTGRALYDATPAEEPTADAPATFKRRHSAWLNTSALSALFAGFYFTLSSEAFTDGTCTDGWQRLRSIIIWGAGLFMIMIFNIIQRRPQWIVILTIGAAVLAFEVISCFQDSIFQWVLLALFFFILLLVMEAPQFLLLSETYGPTKKMRKHRGVIQGRTACSYFLKTMCRAIILVTLLFIMTFMICQGWFRVANWLRELESCPPEYTREQYDEFMARLPSNPGDIPIVPVRYAPGTTAATARFNESLMIGAHNSYHKKGLGGLVIPEWDYDHPPLEEQLRRGYREFEIDIHWVNGVWHVYHIKVMDDQTTCSCLITCLQIINQWSLARNRDHDPLLITIEFRGFTSNELICAKGGKIAERAMDNLQDMLVEMWGPHILTPAELRCPGGACRDSVLDAIEEFGWPRIVDMRAGGKVFVMNMNLFPSNEVCRDVYYNSARYMENRGIFFDRAFDDDYREARRSKTSAFGEGLNQWFDSRDTGFVTRLRDKGFIEGSQVLTIRYNTFPATIYDYDRSPRTQVDFDDNDDNDQ